MAQDTTPAIIVYQGDGSNSVFDVPFDKGYYGEIKVLFVRRGLADYTYSPNTFTVSGRLYAWQNGGAKIYTHTPNPAIGAPTYNSSDVEQANTVSAIAGQTITVDSLVYSRAVQHDISSNMKLTWTGDTLEVGDFICIVRDTERGQPYEMPNNQKHIERALDNIERQVQEVKDATDNALKIDSSHDIPDSHKMNPIDWLKSIIRCMDFSVRAVRLANGWFDYSTDDPNIDDADKTWVHLLNTDNIKAVREQSRIEDGETIYWTEYLAQDGLWKTLSDPHKWDNIKLSDLADTDFTNLSVGQFIMYDGLKWKNVASSATVHWGTILGNLTDQADLIAEFAKYVQTDGNSIMTGPLKMRATSSFQCAIAPFWDGVGFYKLNSDDSVTLIASIETPDGFVPWVTNTYNIGSSLKKWKDLYLAGKAYVTTINNGADLAVPAKSGTLATMGDVELAARSGRMLTDQGVWYAKMYAATVPPAEDDNTNYADFSQVDSDDNPIIVIYTRTSGAWVQSEIITPPSDYDGYVPITSKIWDISEQAGQQGGRVLWNHTSKEFTPYPVIISFEDIEVTGDSTVIMPLNPSGNQIVNKDYVDNHIPTGLSTYHPVLFAHEWDDKIRNDVQWLRADTFSWQSGSVYKAAYKHLRNDMFNWYSWENNGTTIYTKKAYPEVGEKAYSDSALTTEVGEITDVTDTLDITVEKITVNSVVYDSVSGSNISPTTETVGGVTVQYIPAEDGHKIVTDFHESEVADVYTATGVAWYYIIDYGSKRFKLPRTKFGVTGLRDTVGKYVAESLPNIKGVGTIQQTVGTPTGPFYKATAASGGTTYDTASNRTLLGFDASLCSSTYQDDAPVQQKATQMYLYFYVGQFTQTAIENTAGINTELFNDKVDIGHQVIAFQAPTAGNNYTWYRKYADGWVEQGGVYTITVAAFANFNLIVPMADSNYTATGNSAGTTTNAYPLNFSRNDFTTTTFSAKTGNASSGDFYWQVSGMAAS